MVNQFLFTSRELLRPSQKLNFYTGITYLRKNLNLLQITVTQQGSGKAVWFLNFYKSALMHYMDNPHFYFRLIPTDVQQLLY